MLVVAKVLSMAILLQVGLYSTQLLFYTAQEKMIAQNPIAANGDLDREKSMPESIRKMQDGSYLG